MALMTDDCTLLFYGKSINVSYETTLMLGRLSLYASKEDIEKCINKYRNNEKGIDEVEFTDEYSEPLFKILGAKTVDSIDFSNYEKATIIHDMNNPIPSKYYNSFTAIIDGGTIEHVFNFPVAIKNCMQALKVGGHYIGITPANNLMGHGFYQYSPELFYRIFSEENGFVLKKMFVTLTNNDGTGSWYEVADPKNVKERVTLINNYPLSLMFIAEKISEKEIFKSTPQQSDYIYTWGIHHSLSENKKPKGENSLMFLYRKFFPKRLKIVMRNIYNLYHNENINTRELGNINPLHFKKVEL